MTVSHLIAQAPPVLPHAPVSRFCPRYWHRHPFHFSTIRESIPKLMLPDWAHRDDLLPSNPG